MIHTLAYIENLKTEYAELLKNCLAKRLISAQRRRYNYDDIEVTPPDDTAEVVLTFDGLKPLYFSWEQFDDEFDLSISDKSAWMLLQSIHKPKMTAFCRRRLVKV